jgi:heme A synthase
MTTIAASGQRDEGVLSRLRSSLGLGHYALFTALVTYGLIVVGGTVRATNSGEACPDWPLCHGQVIPPADTNVWIEFSHRLLASIVGFMILGLVIAVWRRRPRDPVLFRGTIVVGVVLLIQVLVGGATVGTKTAAGVVAIHLTIALSLWAGLIFVAVRLLRDQKAPTARLQWFPAAVALCILALIITGVFVSQRHAGLAYPDWPLFDGKVTPSDSEAGQLHYAHRIVAGLVGLMVFGLFVHAVRARAASTTVWGLAAACVLFLVQGLLGAANVWLDLATSVRIMHLALASAVWGVLVFTMVWAYQHGHTLSTKGSA